MGFTRCYKTEGLLHI